MPLPLPVPTDKELPERHPQDFYPTPDYSVRSALTMVREYHIGWQPDEILDPGAGAGAWGAVAREYWPMALITGLELRPTPWPASYDTWLIGDFLQPLPADLEENRGRFDLVMGNPPFRFAEEFVRGGLELLRPDGILVYLLRLFFTGSQKRARGLFRECPPSAIGHLSKRPSFSGNGKTKPDEYAIFMWNKNHKGPTAFTWLIYDERPTDRPRRRRRRSDPQLAL